MLLRGVPRINNVIIGAVRKRPLSEGRKVAWAKKKFSDIWFGTPLGKLEASAAWKKWLENLLGGVLGKSACEVACEVAGWARLGLVLGKEAGWGTWKKCLEILMGGGAWEKCVACEVAGRPGLGLVLGNSLGLVHVKNAWKFCFVCFNTKQVVMSN